MQIHAAQRRVSLSVGELASFRLGPASEYGAGSRWRLALGSAWHTSLHEEARAQEAGLRTEVTLSVVLLHKGWRFELSGRIDQIAQSAFADTEELPALPTGTTSSKTTTEATVQATLPTASHAAEEPQTVVPTLVRELKTTGLPLPADEVSLRQHYPHYFRQLALYTYGWQTQETAQAAATVPVCGQLCLVSINDGARQTLQMDAAQAAHEARQTMDRILPFLEERARSRQPADKQAEALQAFAEYRIGQQEALEDLRSHLLTSPVTVFEAPTGFGKTGIALELALEQLRLGVFSRVIYLSGKTTGQHQVMRQLRQMNAQEQWRFFQLRSRREHTGQPMRQRAGRNNTAQIQAELKWQDFGIHPEQLLDEQRTDVDSLRMLAGRTGLCPYELAKACLPYADVWVGDYNYVFSTRHRRVFFDQPGFDPKQTLLIVDEAHNLPSRVADGLSFSLSATAAEAVALDLRLANAPFLLVQAWEAWTAFLQGVKPSNDLPAAIFGEAAEHLRTLAQRMEMAELDTLAPFTREAMAETFWQAQCLCDTSLPNLAWSPRHGVLNFTCLGAAEAIGSTLTAFGASILMTATPGPREVLAGALGLPHNDIHFVPGLAPWRDEAYSVAIDTTVDTRLRFRPQYYQKTADTIGRFALGASGPLTVFFPSYQYAEVVLKYLEALHPALIVKVQPRAIDPGGQLTFVEESLLLAHVLFFVLGSSFSESIDHLGGRVDRAMIVGPALPEVNPVQEARLARLEPLGREEAFRRVYQIPALQKINQALGRLVRAPGQSARVLLHDQRFAQNSYRQLLAPEYRQAQVLTSEGALQDWINQ